MALPSRWDRAVKAIWRPGPKSKGRKKCRHRRSNKHESIRALLDFLPNHVFIVSAVNHGVDLAALGAPEQAPAFDALAKEYVG
jgi:hypothetical protein